MINETYSRGIEQTNRSRGHNLRCDYAYNLDIKSWEVTKKKIQTNPVCRPLNRSLSPARAFLGIICFVQAT